MLDGGVLNQMKCSRRSSMVCSIYRMASALGSSIICPKVACVWGWLHTFIGTRAHPII